MSSFADAKKKAVAAGSPTFTYKGARYRSGAAAPTESKRPKARPNDLHPGRKTNVSGAVKTSPRPQARPTSMSPEEERRQYGDIDFGHSLWPEMDEVAKLGYDPSRARALSLPEGTDLNTYGWYTLGDPNDPLARVGNDVQNMQDKYGIRPDVGPDMVVNAYPNQADTWRHEFRHRGMSQMGKPDISAPYETNSRQHRQVYDGTMIPEELLMRAMDAAQGSQRAMEVMRDHYKVEPGSETHQMLLSAGDAMEARARAQRRSATGAEHYAEGGQVRPQARPAFNFWGALQETADTLNIPVQELATIISYETGGTMNPLQPGPTTQWGKHQGLIQFGEPQAKQYGVDFSSAEAAARSQLGKDGAIVRYALAHGFKPGEHNPLQLYATINAGSPDRVTASDANNGGAPGTVEDKYYNQMGDHRRRVAASMGKSSGQDPMSWEGWDQAKTNTPFFPQQGGAIPEDNERRQREAKAAALDVLARSMQTPKQSVMGNNYQQAPVQAAQMIAIPEN